MQRARPQAMSVRDGAWPWKYIRRRVARNLEPKAPAGDPSAIFGLFDSGGSRIADGKQAMISEAIDRQFAAKGL